MKLLLNVGSTYVQTEGRPIGFWFHVLVAKKTVVTLQTSAYNKPLKFNRSAVLHWLKDGTWVEYKGTVP